MAALVDVFSITIEGAIKKAIYSHIYIFKQKLRPQAQFF